MCFEFNSNVILWDGRYLSTYSYKEWENYIVIEGDFRLFNCKGILNIVNKVLNVREREG